MQVNTWKKNIFKVAWTGVFFVYTRFIAKTPREQTCSQGVFSIFKILIIASNAIATTVKSCYLCQLSILSIAFTSSGLFSE